MYVTRPNGLVPSIIFSFSCNVHRLHLDDPTFFMNYEGHKYRLVLFLNDGKLELLHDVSV